MKKITIVIDMQNDFLTGALANPDAVNIIPSVLEEIKKADYVMYTRDTHGENYLETQEGKNLPVPHCVEGTHGWQIVDDLDPHSIADIKMWHIVNKPTFGDVNIWMAVLLIGATTFVLSAIGVKVGNVFGSRYEKKAQFSGGVILILLGLKILLEHLGVLA